MRRIIVLTLLLAILTIPVFAEYPPEGWIPSITDAIEKAQAEDKMLLLNFTGSDWCSWCIKLKNEVFTTQEYEEWADENLVQVFLDYPRNIELSEETQMQNTILQQMFGVTGYPTIWLIDNDLTPLLKTGYKAGGSASYIAHLENDQIELDEADAMNFRTGLWEGIEEYIGPISPRG